MDDHDFYVPEEKIFGETIKLWTESQQQTEAPKVIISGFPYDEGTKRNGGRIGGAVGSKIFRKALNQFEIYPSKKIEVFDSGDIEADLILETAHQQLKKKHYDFLVEKNQKSLLFSIGGSNDQSYPNVAALLESYPESKIAVINIDAHFDVRPLKEGKVHSGSPFRLMLENQIFQKNNSIFIEFAVKGATCSKNHYDFLQDHHAEVYWMQKSIRKYQLKKASKYRTQGGQLFEQIMKKLQVEVQIIFISFDVDSISSKWMPGVSAPSVIGGLTNEEAIEIIEVTGACKKVRMVDFSEFNPAVESFLSSHLLVEMFFTLCMSFASRFQ